MSDLDDELLGLVDDGSDSELPVSEKATSPSPPPSPGKEPQSDSSDKMVRRGTARPIPKRRRARKDIDEDAEEGELYVVAILCLPFRLHRLISGRPALFFTLHDTCRG